MDPASNRSKAGWMRPLKNRARDVVYGLGLLPLSFRVRCLFAPLRPATILRNTRFRRGHLPDDLPLPSAKARFLVAGSAEIGWFLESGRMGADSIREILHKNHRDITTLASILDFGCGCGRVLRHLRHLQGVKIYAVDPAPLLVEECRRTVPFVRAFVIGRNPPMPFADQSMDLVYCLSVFTHIDEEQQVAWRNEIQRVLRPGGLWLLTTQGIPYLGRMTRTEQERFHSGLLVCQYEKYRGQIFCQTYHPARYVREILARGFSVLDYLPEGARGNPEQDLFLLSRDNNS